MISVIVNHYRSPIALKLCLRSIADALAHIPHEVIVADSAAERKTQRMLAHDFPHVRYLPFGENVGFAKLVNAGIAHAREDFLLILNADTILISGTVEVLLEYLSIHPDVGIVGPRLEYQNGNHQPSAFRFYTPLVIVARRTVVGKLSFGKRALDHFMLRDVIGDPQRDLSRMEPIPVDWLMGSAWLVRRKAASSVGPLDERFFLYFEDVDWCRRFWEKGWSVVWIPSVRIVHVHAQASKKRGGIFDVILNPLTRVHIASAIRYFRKYGLRTPRYGR
jgi:hypothetical protein